MGSSGTLDTRKKIVVLFDGVCNLCNSAVQFIIRRDPAFNFRFSSLQSEFSKTQLTKFGLDPESLHSIVVIADEKVFQRSEALFVISKHLHGGWWWLWVFKVLPKFATDGMYNMIAANRYKIFGKRESCMIPSPAHKDRFTE